MNSIRRYAISTALQIFDFKDPSDEMKNINSMFGYAFGHYEQDEEEKFSLAEFKQLFAEIKKRSIDFTLPNFQDILMDWIMNESPDETDWESIKYLISKIITKETINTVICDNSCHEDENISSPCSLFHWFLIFAFTEKSESILKEGIQLFHKKGYVPTPHYKLLWKTINDYSFQDHFPDDIRTCLLQMTLPYKRDHIQEANYIFNKKGMSGLLDYVFGHIDQYGKSGGISFSLEELKQLEIFKISNVQQDIRKCLLEYHYSSIFRWDFLEYIITNILTPETINIISRDECENLCNPCTLFHWLVKDYNKNSEMITKIIKMFTEKQYDFTFAPKQLWNYFCNDDEIKAQLRIIVPSGETLFVRKKIDKK